MSTTEHEIITAIEAHEHYYAHSDTAPAHDCHVTVNPAFIQRERASKVVPASLLPQIVATYRNGDSAVIGRADVALRNGDWVCRSIRYDQ